MNDKKKLISLVLLCFATVGFSQNIPLSAEEDKDNIMSEKYWSYWNKETLEKIEKDIEANRKANAVIKIDAKDGTEVKIDQLTHDFIFGAHIFNFNQLGSKEYNDKYKALYGTFFNSATIPFYWSTFEFKPGHLRFETEEWDTEEFWNKCKDPENQPHWRRPSTDQLVDFCEKKGIRAHGHPFVWGSINSHYPAWTYEKYASEEERKHIYPFLDAKLNAAKSKFDKETLEKYKKMSADELAEIIPNFTKNLNESMEKRIREITERYKGRLQSWDVCNESVISDGKKHIVEGGKLVQNNKRYGLMPGDYPYVSFKLAEKYLPKEVKLNINDYFINRSYARQVKRLVERGAKIDIVGHQMHIFNVNETKEISEGANKRTPGMFLEKLKTLDETGIPIHLSEITVSAPGTEELDKKIQAVISANLYRLWFSHKSVMGITWWNVVDGCGYKGEPSLSGMFERNMTPKPVFYAINDLINKKWKTNLVESVKDGEIKFRGFRGKYRLTWTTPTGETKSMEYYLK